jgi:hypothetical protein
MSFQFLRFFKGYLYPNHGLKAVANERTAFGYGFIH